jgi:hypothetical protein
MTRPHLGILWKAILIITTPLYPVKAPRSATGIPNVAAERYRLE